ncbi:MAG: iron ABC transporter permease [Planctomycetes bacterium]|jgi:iron complex transport system permease protein|nr:iron ABC transporter permease [Planctomycetota bacterium]MCL4730945.1 iron ABC transporter permease [Planctomycetota bacterium]
MKARVAMLCVLSAAVIVASPWAGGLPDGELGHWVLVELRIPRVLMAVVVGGVLSLVGACFQTIFANPLAAPSTVGTTAGATLGALMALVLGPALGLGGYAAGVSLPLTALAAFAGALVVSLPIAAVAASGRARVNDVLLAGVAVSLAAGALATGLQYTADQAALQTAVLWSLGHLPQVGYRDLLMLLPFAVPVCAFLLLQTRALNALLGGEQRAFSQGVDVPRVRALTLGMGALGVAACVAVCGPIAFVGLVVPHIVRLALGPNRRVMLPMSLVTGAGFLAACDLGGRLILPGRELPVGVITAALGAPTLVWLIVRGSRA